MLGSLLEDDIFQVVAAELLSRSERKAVLGTTILQALQSDGKMS